MIFMTWHFNLAQAKTRLLTLTLILFGVLISGLASTPVLASEEKKDNGEASKESYVKVPSFAVTMYHRGRPKGNMTIQMLVKLVDSERRATAVKYMPRLSSAYVIEASRLSHDYFDVTQPVNVAMLGDAFQLVTNKVLGHTHARVLISDVIVNKR
ncbi:MAG: hypothetical protein COB54_05740 [Alphaproteobacteria bacterium]|nr:MAG: hypothetical protein COB54_05740 [Alphaproteobacteria bacterium]